MCRGYLLTWLLPTAPACSAFASSVTAPELIELFVVRNLEETLGQLVHRRLQPVRDAGVDAGSTCTNSMWGS